MNDGGPVFPTSIKPSCDHHPGLSLRDYFAAAAMNGILSGALQMDKNQTLCRASYGIADDILAEREKGD